MHQPLAFGDLDERVHLQVAPRRHRVLICCLRLLIVLPLFLVHVRAGERVANHVLHALARRRIPPRALLIDAGRRPLRILAERELDAGQRAGEQQLIGLGHAPAELDVDGLSAVGARAPVQDVRRRHAAGQVPLTRYVERVQHVAHARHRAHRRGALVDGVVRDVRVRVDDAGRHELALALDDLRPAGICTFVPTRGDFAVAHHDGAVVDRAVRDGDERRVANGDDRRRRLRQVRFRFTADWRDRNGYERSDNKQGTEQGGMEIASIH